MSRTLDNDWRRRGRPKKTWRKTFQGDLTRANIIWEEAEHNATDRPIWRQAAAQYAYWHGVVFRLRLCTHLHCEVSSMQILR